MAGAGLHLGAHHCLYVWGFFLVDEVADILFRRQADHNAKAVSLRRVEQRYGRYGVGNADRIQAACRHLGKVSLNDLQVVILTAMHVRPKCPICYATNP